MRLNFRVSILSLKYQSFELVLTNKNSEVIIQCLYYRTVFIHLYHKTMSCHRIMLGIKQPRDYMTNESQYHLSGQALLRQRQLKFTGHCSRIPTDGPDNRFVIYESKIRSSLRPDVLRTIYLNQISSHILPDEKTLEDNQIRRMAANKSEQSQLFVVSKKKNPLDRLSQLE